MTKPFLDLPPDGKNDAGRYGLGLVIIFFFWLILGPLPYALFVPPAGDDPNPLLPFIFLNVSFWFLILGLFVTVRLVHQRPFLTLITPYKTVSWRRIGQGFIVYLLIITLLGIVEFLITPQNFEFVFDPAAFFPFLIAMLILIPIQTSAEELLFRGYLLQGMGQLSRNVWLLALLNGLIFMLPHLGNPEVARAPVLLALFFFVNGFFLAIVTLRDNRLELALGAHAANNLFAGIFVNYADSVLRTESLFLISELNAGYSLIAMGVTAVLFYGWFFGRGVRAA